MDAAVRCKEVYALLYAKSITPPKPVSIEQRAHEASLLEYPGGKTYGAWHKRYGTKGRAKGPLRRFYFNVMPDGATDVAAELTRNLERSSIPFSLKIATKLSAIARRRSAMVLYVSRDDYEVAKRVSIRLADRLSHAFHPDVPAFTKEIRPGVGAADDVDGTRAPPTRERHSFGSARADILCEVVGSGATLPTRADLGRAVRQRFKHYGLDPARPWLRRASEPDDL